MDVRLLYFDDCPNWRLAAARLREALADLGDPAPAVTHERVSTPEQAEHTGFRGSPTILVNGRDPFARPDDPVGLSCRIYRSAGGVEHAPTVEQLRSVLAVPTEGPSRGGGVAGLAALGLAVCCGLPVLLSLGAGITIAGVGLRSWLLGLSGLLLVVVASVWRNRRRARCAVPDRDRRGA